MPTRAMPRKKHSPIKREGAEKRRENFNLFQERVRRGRETGKDWASQGHLTRVFPNAFGTKKQVEGAEYIGAEGPLKKPPKGKPLNVRRPDLESPETTHWYIERRGRKRKA